jgi:hypothetical protein
MFRRFLITLGLLLAMLGPAAAQNRFTFINNSGQQINELYVSASRITSWGRDTLGANVLAPGGRLWLVPDTSDCFVDLRVVFASGAVEERRQVNACQISQFAWNTPPSTVAKGGDPSFRFTNSTGLVVRELYVSLSTDNNWGPDRLGQGVLAPGQYTWVALPGGRSCQVDIRVVYGDGRRAEGRRLETCSIRELNWRG